MTENDILALIEKDPWMMEVISVAASLNLKDWIIGAGFVRNKVWDYLSGRNPNTVDTPDIDLVYYDPTGNDEAADEALSAKLQAQTGFNWEIINEFYAHVWNNLSPYKSTEDAISHWTETVTAIGVTLDQHGQLRLFAPYGIDDLVNFIVRPTPAFLDKIERIRERVAKKKWLEKWPNIRIVTGA